MLELTGGQGILFYMHKPSEFVRRVAATGMLVVLSVIFVQYFFPPLARTDGLHVTGTSELLGVVNSLVITLFSALAVFFHAFSQGKFNKRILSLIFVLSAFLIMSIHNGGWKSGLFTVLSISLTYIYLFDIARRAATQEIAVTVVKYFFSIAAILPVVIYVLMPAAREGFESYEGHFKGFETSRTTYGFVACVAFSLHLLERRRGWLVWISAILIGTFMAQSRIAVVIFAALSIYTLRHDHRIKNKKLALVALGITLPVMVAVFVAIGSRGDELFEESMRYILLQNHIDYVMANLLFGAGGDITLEAIVMPDGGLKVGSVSAHNFIVETLVGFGLLATITWLALLWVLWKNINRTGRAFMIFLIIYGMFHNGFGLSVLNSANYILLTLAVFIKNYFEEPKYAHAAKIRSGFNKNVDLPRISLIDDAAPK
ncbi:MAG: hypothetical protein A2W33_07380 [Chloroflexi bacterium RBG_16_52_11]|nr:MAG: hypothetical protein A2W33_07380 [Chloroflexi bacterium RBG_16_52_11]